MTWQDYDIVGGYNNQHYTEIDAERSINLFVYLDSQSKKPKTLIKTSGLINNNSFYPDETLGFRQQFTFGDSVYSIIGTKVFRQVLPGLTVSLLGDIGGTGVGYAAITANTFQVLFVDGSTGWIYDIQTNLFIQITDPAFPTRPIDATYLDGFFIVANGETNTFQLSSFNQGLVWGVGSNTFTITVPTTNIVLTTGSTLNYQIGTIVDFFGVPPPPELSSTAFYYVVDIVDSVTFRVSATKGGTPISFTTTNGAGTVNNQGQLQLGSITSAPGTIQACRVLHRRLFLWAEYFCEVWENSGQGTNLPLRRNNSYLIEYGTPSIASIKVGFDKMFFLSQDQDGLGPVLQVNGTQAFPVSNRALDEKFSEYGALDQISDATSILIRENGLTFYRINFTKANATYIYDIDMSDPSSDSTRIWHEEWDLHENRHWGQTHAYIGGKNYYGDYRTPTLYIVDPNTDTNAGENIPRIRIGKPIIAPTYQRIRIDRFHLDVLQGDKLFETVSEKFNADATTDIITLTNTFFILGSSIVFSTLGSLPSPLVAGTTYYAIPINSTQLRIATSYSNAAKGIYINLLDNGSSPSLIEISTPVSYNPTIFLSVSKDGGQSYGNKFLGTMGKVGERSSRSVWRKLGTIPRGQAFVPKIEFYQSVPFTILGASWVFEVLPE